MIAQLALGSLLICLTIVIEVVFIGIAIRFLAHYKSWLNDGSRLSRFMLRLVGIVFWLLLALVIAVWIWAMAFLWLDVFDDLETALYFSIVSFTTLGFGDIIVGKDWRLLSGFSAANGLIMFSLTTAFLIESISDLRDSNGGNKGKDDD
ncbi:MAG: potassium channel family protein [Pseudomonadota bacterium]